MKPGVRSRSREARRGLWRAAVEVWSGIAEFLAGWVWEDVRTVFVQGRLAMRGLIG